MKRIAALISALALACALTACGSSTEASNPISVNSDTNGVHAVAQYSANGSGTGTITITDGFGLSVNHSATKGSFHVTALEGETNKAIFDEKLEGNGVHNVDVKPGTYTVVISADKATGTVDIVNYSKRTQAKAGSTLDTCLDVLAGEGAGDGANDGVQQLIIHKKQTEDKN